MSLDVGAVTSESIEWDWSIDTATQWRRIGECNKCGDCCKVVVRCQISDATYEEGDVRTLEFSVFGEEPWVEPLDNNDERRLIRFFSTGEQHVCQALSYDNKCIVHGSDKSFQCSSWPTCPDDIKNFPRCSYRFEMVESWHFASEQAS
jgi:hypothetical protein